MTKTRIPPALCHPQELQMGIYVPKIEMRSALNVSIFHFLRDPNPSNARAPLRHTPLGCWPSYTNVMAASGGGEREMEAWSEADVIAYLTQKTFAGLQIENFASINGKVLSELTTSNLHELGVESTMHQKKICRAVEVEHGRLKGVAAAHSVEGWSEKDVKAYLERENFSGVDIARFADYDGSMLLDVGLDELHELGVGSEVNRKIVRAAIDKLFDPVVAAQQDPEMMRALKESKEKNAAAEAELARLAVLHADDEAALASAEAAAAAAANAAATELEELKAKKAAAEQAAHYGVKAQIKAKLIQFTDPPRILGSGASGEVLHGAYTVVGQTRGVALKVFHGSKGKQLCDREREKIMKEVEVRERVVCSAHHSFVLIHIRMQAAYPPTHIPLQHTRTHGRAHIPPPCSVR